MPGNELTFEEVDKAVETVDLSFHQPGGRHHFTAETLVTNPAAAIPNICAIYSPVKPILIFVSRILPRKWKAIINTFMDLMNGLCPAR